MTQNPPRQFQNCFLKISFINLGIYQKLKVFINSFWKQLVLLKSNILRKMGKIYILLIQPVQFRKSFIQLNGVLNCTRPNPFLQALRAVSLIANFLTTGTINRPGTIHSLFKMIAFLIPGYSFSTENSKLSNFLSGSSNGGLILEISLKHLYQKSNLVLTSPNNITNLL